MPNVALVSASRVTQIVPFTAELLSSDMGEAVLVADPYQQFKPGDAITEERYAELYPGLVNPFSPGDLTSSVFCPLPDTRLAPFANVGLRINPHPNLHSPYAYCSRDTPSAVDALAAYASYHQTKVFDFALMNKAQATDRFAAAGFTTLLTRPLLSREDLESFPHTDVILKPAVGTGSMSKGHVLDSALYTIRTKSELLDTLDGLGAFSDLSVLTNNPVIIQQAADGSGALYPALILSGGVNGQGAVCHFSPITLATSFVDGARSAKTVWSPENVTEEIRQMQQKVEALVTGTKNCFYQLQFLRCGGVWVPHDFQFRMTYYVDGGLHVVEHPNFKYDILKFVFDRTTDAPEQPCSFGLSFVGSRNGAPKMQFVTGATKAEVLTKLESM